ncbi:MAG TPA: hypothetical protein PK030_03640 [Bacilli bacterium]|nr:hypothetical protein [Bacilli bacterium]
MDIVRLIVILAPVLMLALLVGAWLLMRRTMRTRIEMDSQLKKDSEISENDIKKYLVFHLITHFIFSRFKANK